MALYFNEVESEFWCAEIKLEEPYSMEELHYS